MYSDFFQMLNHTNNPIVNCYYNCMNKNRQFRMFHAIDFMKL